MKKNSTLVDRSAGTGVFKADLKYGRMNGDTPSKNGDFAGEENQPISPLVLVNPRDPHVWKKDNRVKEMRRTQGMPQSYVNYLMDEFSSNLKYLRANYHLTVGKQRL
jgi:hypothetical protein